MIFSLCQTHFKSLIKLLIYLLKDSNICLIYMLIKHLSFYIDVLFFHVVVVVLLLVHASSFACQQLPRQICQNLQFQVVSVFILFCFIFVFFFQLPTVRLQFVSCLLSICTVCIRNIYIYFIFLFIKKHAGEISAKR